MNNSNFAFTLMIPSFKKVNFNGAYIPYGNLSQINQLSFLKKLLEKVITDRFILQYDYVSERHQDGRIHLHGSIYGLSEGQHNSLREAVCLEIGIKQPKQQADIFCILPIYNSLGWSKYCHKQYEDEDDSPSADGERFNKYMFKGKNENDLKK